MDDWRKIELLIESGKYEQAMVEARSVLATDPGNVSVLGQLGRAELGLERFGEVLDSAARLIALQPDDHLGFWLRGAAMLGLDQYAEATKSFRQTLRLLPEQADAHCLLARTLIAQAGGLPRKLGQSLIDEAKQEIDHARSLNPNSFEVHYASALWALISEDLDNANQEIRAALSIDPNSARANHVLGIIQEQSGDSVEASNSYLQAGRLDPTSNSAMEQLHELAGGSPIPPIMISIGIIWVAISVAGVRSSATAITAIILTLGLGCWHWLGRRTSLSPEAQELLDREEQLRSSKFPFS